MSRGGFGRVGRGVVGVLSLALAAATPPLPISEAELTRLEERSDSEAREVLREVAERLESPRSARERVQLLNVRANALIRVSELDAARATLAEVESLAVTGDLREERAVGWLHRSTILFRTSDYGEAYAEVAKALRAFEELGRTRRLAKASSRAFTILIDLGDFEKARAHGDAAVRLATEGGFLFDLAAYLSNFAYFHYRQKQYDEMLAWARRSLEVYERIGERAQSRYPLVNGGVALLELGRYREAQEYLSRALPIALAREDRGNEVVTRKFLARTLRSLGQGGAALREAETALALARKIGNRFEVKNVLLELSAIHHAAGRSAEAYHDLAEALELQQQIQGAEVHGKVAGVLGRLEIEKREGQIRLLRKERELSELAVRSQRTARNLLAALLALAVAGGVVALRAFVQKKRSAETIGRQNEELVALDRIVRDINEEVELRPLIEQIFRNSRALFPQAQRGGFLYLSEDEGRFRSVVSFGYPEEELDLVSFSPEEARERYVEGGAELANGLFVVRRPKALEGPAGALPAPMAILAFEIRSDGTPVGDLLQESADDAAAFDRVDVRRVKTFHEHIISAVHKARHLAQVEKLSRTDALTRLPNRRSLQERLAQEVHRAERYGSPFLVAMCDLDDFKKVNDTHGHDAGDAVLRAAARVMVENLRRTDVVGRWGGEEFIVLLPETELAGGRTALEKVRARLSAQPVPWGEAALAVTVSVGVTAFAKGERVEDVVARADEALYEAKRAGKNRVVAAEPGRQRPQGGAPGATPPASPA